MEYAVSSILIILKKIRVIYEKLIFRAYMYILYDEIIEEHGILSYMRPFSKQLWWAILASVITIAMCTLILGCKTSDFGFVSACFQPLEAFLNQGNKSN